MYHRICWVYPLRAPVSFPARAISSDRGYCPSSSGHPPKPVTALTSTMFSKFPTRKPTQEGGWQLSWVKPFIWRLDLRWHLWPLVVAGFDFFTSKPYGLSLPLKKKREPVCEVKGIQACILYIYDIYIYIHIYIYMIHIYIYIHSVRRLDIHTHTGPQNSSSGKHSQQEVSNFGTCTLPRFQGEERDLTL